MAIAPGASDAGGLHVVPFSVFSRLESQALRAAEAGESAWLRLVEMLRCLGGFRHIRTDSAKLVAMRVPLLEVLVGEFLRAVEHIVKRDPVPTGSLRW